jgi:hypothetical protein
MNQMEAIQEYMALAETEDGQEFPANNANSSNTSNDAPSSNISQNSTKPCDRNASEATQQVEKPGKCKCIGSKGKGYPLLGAITKQEVYAYPKNAVGSECKAWDLGVYPGKCTREKENEPFCAEKWCYVDPCTCEAESFPSSYFPDTRLHYSYEACGGTDSFTQFYHGPAFGPACGSPKNQNKSSCELLLKCRWFRNKCISEVMSRCAAKALWVPNITKPAAPVKVQKTNVSIQRDSVPKKTKTKAPPSMRNTTDVDVDVSKGVLVMFLYATIPFEIIIIVSIYYKVKRNQNVLLDDSSRAKIRFKITIEGVERERLADERALSNRVVTRLTSLVADFAGNETSAEDVDAKLDCG